MQRIAMLPLINRSVNSYGRSLLQVSEIVGYAREHSIPVVGLTDVHTLAGIPSFLASCEREGIHGVAGLTLQILDGGAYRGELVLMGKGDEGFSSLKSLLDIAGHVADGSKEFNPNMGLELSTLLSGEYKEQLSHCIALDGFNGSIAKSLVLDNGDPSIVEIKQLYKGDNPLSQLKSQFNDGEYLAVQLPGELNNIAAALSPTEANDTGYTVVESTIAHAKSFEHLMATKQWFSMYAEKWLSTFDESGGLKWVDDLYSKRCFAVAGKKPSGNAAPFVNASFFIGRCPAPNVFSNKFRADMMTGGVDALPLHLSVSAAWVEYKKSLPMEKIPVYAARLSEEIKVIYAQGFADYFRNIQKAQALCDETNNGYMLRGSAVSSLVMHVLGMTPIDPVENGLLFRRFIDEARAEEPDADIELVNPDQILNDMNKHFGNNQFAVLSSADGIKKTEKLFASAYKALVQFRTLSNDNRNTVELVAKYLQRQQRMLQKPWAEFKEKMLDDLLRRAPNNPGVSQALSKFVQIADMLSLGYQGASVNKGSVVIVPEGVDKYFSSLIVGKGDSGLDLPRIEMTKQTLNGTGVIKYDFLSNNIFKRHYLGMQAVGLDPYISASYDDMAIAHVFKRGAHLGISQLGGFTGENLAKKFVPESFQQLTAMFALMRDANVASDNGIVNDYLEGKNAPENVVIHPLYKDILGDTYGAMLYEEQLMTGLTVVGGFTWAEADKFRSRLKKGDKNVVSDNESVFIDNVMSSHGLSHDEASKLYQPFRDKHGRFVFSKAHGSAYAHLAVQQCVFKCMYPAQYAAELYLDKKGVKNAKKLGLDDVISDWLIVRDGMPENSTFQTAEDLPEAIKIIVEREANTPLSTYKSDLGSIIGDIHGAIENGKLDKLIALGGSRLELSKKVDEILVPLLELNVQKASRKSSNPSSTPSDKKSSNDQEQGVKSTLPTPATDNSYVPLNRRSGFIDWYQGVMPLQLVDFLAMNRLISVESVDTSKAKALDHVRFSFKSAKDGQVKKYHIAAVSTDPVRVKNRANYDLNSALHQGGSKNKKKFYTSQLMAMLANDGLTEDIPSVTFEGTHKLNREDAKLMMRYYTKMAKASKYPLYGSEMLENSISKMSISKPISSIMPDLYPKALAEAQKLVPEMFDKGRSIDSSGLSALFKSGSLSFGQRFSEPRESKKVPGTFYRQNYTNIYANFKKVERNTPLRDITFPEGVLSPGGHQFILKDIRKNKVSRVDHGTNNVKGHFFGDPILGSDFLWFTEGVFDALAFNEIQSVLLRHKISGSVEPNAISIKSANGGIALMQVMLGVQMLVDDKTPQVKVDFCLNDWNMDLKELDELSLEDIGGWFKEHTIHWIDDGSKDSLMLQHQLMSLMQQSGLSADDISSHIVSHQTNARNSITNITNTLCRTGSVGREPNHIIMHKGVMPQWLHMNNLAFAKVNETHVAYKLESNPRKSERFSEMSPERKTEVGGWVKKQFVYMSGAKGLGLALDNDNAGRKEAIVLAKFADLIGIPYQALMPKPKTYNLDGKVHELKDHNDYLAVAKQLDAQHNPLGAKALLEDYISNLTKPSRPLVCNLDSEPDKNTLSGVANKKVS